MRNQERIATLERVIEEDYMHAVRLTNNVETLSALELRKLDWRLRNCAEQVTTYTNLKHGDD